MSVRVREIGAHELERYGAIPIAFHVSRVLDVRLNDGGLGGVALSESRLRRPYTKDYDALGEGGPARWAERFDVGRWGFALAVDDSRDVGGAAVALDTPGLHMLRGRRDLAVLWDIRVVPELRGRGVGTMLFDWAVHWSKERGCVQLIVETQNVNVPACRFYRELGCQLCGIDRLAYFGQPEVGEEVQLLWVLDL